MPAAFVSGVSSVTDASLLADEQLAKLVFMYIENASFFYGFREPGQAVGGCQSREDVWQAAASGKLALLYMYPVSPCFLLCSMSFNVSQLP